jgi:RHS repeat-associated protein
MRSRNTLARKTFSLALAVFLLSLLPSSYAAAAEEPYVNSVRGTAVSPGASFYVTDEKFLSAGTFYGSIRPAPYSLTPENIVELKLFYDTTAYFYDKKFTATVNITVLCYNNAWDTSQVFTQYNNIDLTIKHDTATGTPYKGVHFLKFNGAYKFRVIINSITCPELGSNMPPVLSVEGKTVIKRKYNFSPTTTDVTKIEEPAGQIKLSWIPANYQGAELFDLEYTVVDDSSTAGESIRNYLSTSTPIPQSVMEGLFRNNASRIVTAANNYTLNPLYRAGYLLFRIRGVQFANEYQASLSDAEQNLRTEGNWNYSAAKLNQPSYQYNVVQLQWHEQNLNWQYTISFAEEGKRKEAIGYFDGILKNRQNVTINNSDKKTVVHETIHDAFGRSAINVLPAPTNDSTIHYFSVFNQNKNGKAYSYKDFAFGTTCRTIPDTMSRVSGAHHYYSSSNSINDYFFKKYIPQAEGYPFTVTEYTADNTGRVFAQGNVGKDFQPGSNHETKYYYSKPTQEELDKMFGSEAGNASHYLKNMVVNPNGQISVTYVNASGKTIATALAGITPPNLEALSSNNGTGTDVNKTLLISPDFNRDYASNTLLGSSSFLAAVSGNYKFTYNFTPLRLDVLHGINSQFKICNTCYYDLLITVSDNCNQVLRTISRPVDANTIFQTDCNITPAPVSDTFSVDILNIGEYAVSYQLRISERAWAFYDSVHLAQNTNIRTFNSFVLEKLNQADFKGCFSECSTCLTELGSRTDFINNKVMPLFLRGDTLSFTSEFNTWANALYDSLLLHCNSIQPGCIPSPCDEEKELLLDDVSPGGQYALYDANFILIDPFTNVLDNRYYLTFTNEDGTPGKIEVNGQLVDAGSPLVSDKAFIENFDRGWAETLLQFHPEYCFYQWCLYGTNPDSKAFDIKVQDIEDATTATSLGYFGTVGSLLNADPFFSPSGYGYPYYWQMLDSLNYFSSTMPGYGGPAFNILQYIDYELYCEAFGVAPGSCTLPAANDPCRSPYMEWQLYRDYYLNLKAYFQEKARLANPSFAECRNCYIGTDYTEFLVCNAPPASDFTIELDPTYTSGKRIIVKYKNGEMAFPHKLKLTFSYNYGTFVQTFRAGRATELYVVPASVNDYYAITLVECDTSSGGGGSRVQQQSVSGSPTKPAINSSISMPSCPCPSYFDFSTYLTGLQCWDGPEYGVDYYGSEIPPCRTVYVDIYWEEWNTGYSGISTVSFTGTQTYASNCIYSGLWYGNYSVSIWNVYCVDDPCFNCGGEEGDPGSLCKDDPLYPYYKNKIRRYAGYQNPHGFYQTMMSNYSSYLNQANTNLTSECQSNCEAQADVWINAISKCTTDVNLLNTIKAQMISLCQNACNNSHPYGASSNFNNTQTFESIIRQYIPASSDSCTAELISDPYPYNRQPQFENQIMIQVDNCLSTRFNALKTQYQSAVSGGYVGTFHDWLQKQLKTDYTLTQQELTDLETSINNNCKYLKKPLELPVAFSCGSMPACIDSATTMQTYAAFLVKYPGITIANQYYETLLTNYFNHTFGYSLSYEDYQSYIEKCQTGTTNKDLLCNRAVSSQVVVTEDVMKCMADVFDLAVAQAVSEYTVYIDSVRTAFRNAYMGKCMNVDAKLTMNAKLYEYHYTLYYYDQSGNLVKTIPPEGVQLLTDAQVAQVQSNRLNSNNYCYTNAPELTFNGNIITMPREYSYDPVVNGQYSLEAWVKLGNLNIAGPNGLFSYNAVISSPTEAGWALIQRNSRLAFIVGTSPKLQVETPLLSTFLSANTWFHIVVTVNNNSMAPVKIYINGNNVPLTYLNNNSAFYAVQPSNTHQLRVGGAFDNNGLTAVSSAGIKQFRWYQRMLNTSEIQNNAFSNCFLPASPAAIVSYIPVNEGTGNVMEDKINYNLSTMNGNTNAVWQNYIAGYYPGHRLATNYQYNSINQLVRQITPDAGLTTYWYDILSRLVATQTAEQLAPKNTANSSVKRYSYTKYDALGRIVEVGEKYSGTELIPIDDDIIPIGALNPKNATQLNTWYASGNDRQVTMTIYDQPNTVLVTNTNITNLQAYNSRKRVVASIYKELKSNSYYDFATHYVYDISGNVKTLFQDLKPMRDVELVLLPEVGGVRRINYEYDLVSGKVNKAIYQPGKGDQFIYKYEYDADNRLTGAHSSRNGLQWQEDAHYYYYLHGHLARMELGKNKVQGVDYAYTLQGWLKGINGQTLDITKDMAGDGNASNTAFRNFGRDVYAFSIGYHNNDYKPIGGTAANAFDLSFTAPAGAVGTTGNTGSQMFNGCVTYTTIALNKLNNGQTTGYSYLYDQLNRLLGTRQHSINGTSWNYSSYNAAYEERATYDGNGNMKTYVRKGGNASGLPLAMDNLKYFYYYVNTSNVRSEYDPTQALPGDVKMLTSQLAHVDDSDPGSNYAVDIDDQNAANYDYDNNGNLIKDVAAGITSISWTVYGKIKQVQKSNGVIINYQYDAAGYRVVKEVMNAPGGYNRQFYIRDGDGNVLAVYKDEQDEVSWTEQHLYGSNRLGIWSYGKIAPLSVPSVVNDTAMVGSVQYELSNHVGNVLTTISDKKIGVSANGITVDYYNAEVIMQADYYPFGMVMTGRQYISGSSYRYGFNGKEKSEEIFVEAYSFEARVYDARLGRFLSTDPRESEYAWQSTYVYFSNSPVSQIDFNGEGAPPEEKQKVQKYTNPEIKDLEGTLVRLRGQLQKARDKYWAYYKKIGKLNDKSTEADFQKVLSAANKEELTRINGLITTSSANLTKARATEAQWNKLDKEIEDVVHDFNIRRGYTGNNRLDPNLVKALMFSESEMGAGEDYKALVAWLPTARPDARYQLNLGRVGDVYATVMTEFSIPVDWKTNYLAWGNKNDVMLAAGAMMQKQDYAKTIGKSDHFKANMPWFNAVVAYKGVSAEGKRKAELVWKLYTTGAHPYTPGKQLFKKN